ncbi:MAG: Cu(I)-responsive transcriptional regulator [Rhizobiales bacterium]|nr:Cu(I)-responsive transcriptional regulator [Hyphomicrobiales bacterium]
MKIQQAATLSELPVKTVRYYDEIELVSPDRQDNGYRFYSDKDIEKLRFLGRARSLGFSLEDCRQLLSLYEDKNRASSEVKSIAESKILEIEAKLIELQSLRDTLTKLADSCSGDERPDCPILEGLAGN